MPVDEAACKFLEEATLLDLHTLYNPLPFFLLTQSITNLVISFFFSFFHHSFSYYK